MLVIGRRVKEAIRIGDDVRIVVTRGANVRIGIEAPESTNIVREELIPVPGLNHDGGPDRLDGAPSDGFFTERGT